jgi:hypothetical protein
MSSVVRSSSLCSCFRPRSFSTASAPPPPPRSSATPSTSRRPTVILNGPFGSKHNVADGPPPPPNASFGDRLVHYGVKGSWTLIGAGLLGVGVTAVAYVFLKDVELFQPRDSPWWLIQKSLKLMNQHRACVHFAGHVSENPQKIAEARGLPHGHALAEKFVRTHKGDRIRFQFQIEVAKTDVVSATVLVDARRQNGVFDIYGLSVMLPRLNKKIVIMSRGSMTAQTLPSDKRVI